MDLKKVLFLRSFSVFFCVSDGFAYVDLQHNYNYVTRSKERNDP